MSKRKTEFTSLPRQGFNREETAYIIGISVERLNDCIEAGLIQPIRVGESDRPKFIFDFEQIKAFMRDMRGETIGTKKDLYEARANIDGRNIHRPS